MIEDRILLVDDEDQFVVALSKRLKARGLTVEAADGGEAALELLERREFDAIVLDLAMPGMDGIQTLERVLQIDPDAQVILLTGHGSVQAARDAMRAGAADFLEKPADFSELMQKIRAAITKKMQLSNQHTEDQIADILRKKGW